MAPTRGRPSGRCPFGRPRRPRTRPSPGIGNAPETAEKNRPGGGGGVRGKSMYNVPGRGLGINITLRAGFQADLVGIDCMKIANLSLRNWLPVEFGRNEIANITN